jgi:hypothetical protein
MKDEPEEHVVGRRRLPREPGEQSVGRHHSCFRTGLGKGTDTADERGGTDPVGQEAGAGRRMRPSAGDAEHREAFDAQVVGQFGYVVRPSFERALPLPGAGPASRPVRSDHSDACRERGRRVEEGLATGAGCAVERENRVARGVAHLCPGQLAPVG